MNLEFLNQHRVRKGDPSVPSVYWSDDSYGCNGMFRFWIDNKPIRCIASDGGGWKHVSVTVEGDKRVPPWNVMCAVKDLFWDEEEWVVQFHPAKSEYVNKCTTCLHLWQSLNAPQPTPNSNMVGIKT